MGRSLAEGLPILQQHEKLFINIHPKTLQRGKLPELEDPERVVFEITEQTPINHHVRRTMESLTLSGVSYAIDDYGIGYSNLDRFSHSWLLPFYLKLDRFVYQAYPS